MKSFRELGRAGQLRCAEIMTEREGVRSLQRLKVSGRFLVREDGRPFFWLGDTAWELFHKLNREDAGLYLKQRAGLGFNVVQAVALAELDGLTAPNAYGRLPLKLGGGGLPDPAMPDEEGPYSYWDHVDYIVDKAAELGLYVALLPTWGDKFNPMWGRGPAVFTPGNARIYGEWIGRRYRSRANIVWVMGGDRPLLEMDHFAVVRAMAEGIRDACGDSHLITFHPAGGSSSSKHVHRERWLDFNMVQSSHGDEAPVNYKWIREDYALSPVKPTFDGEPCYEDIPRGFNVANGYFDAADARRAAYYNVFSGGFGHTYGHHSVWSMSTESDDNFIMHWKDALDRPGAAQMRHLRTLAESRPMLERIPDQSLIARNGEGHNCMVAARGERYAFIYFPNGVKAGIRLGVLPGNRVTFFWFDPRTGQSTEPETADNNGLRSFAPPSAGRGNDWVLVMDACKP